MVLVGVKILVVEKKWFSMVHISENGGNGELFVYHAHLFAYYSSYNYACCTMESIEQVTRP